jgi:hypothetical protein
MLTLDDEYDKAAAARRRIQDALGNVPMQPETRFASEWGAIHDLLDAAHDKSRALRDKIAAMEEG